MLAVSITCRRRAMRLISDGPVPGLQRRRRRAAAPCRASPTAPRPAAIALRIVAVLRSLGAHVHLVLLAALVVVGDLLAADEDVERRGDVLHAHAEVGRLVAVDADAELRLADDEVRVGVDDARHLGFSSAMSTSASTCRAWSRSGPPIQNMISALTPPPKALTGATCVRRFERARTAAGSCCAPAAMICELVVLALLDRHELDVDRCRGSACAADRRRWSPRWCATPASLRTRAAIDSRIVCVVSRLAPSGARTCTWNCDSSSWGRKFLLTAMNERHDRDEHQDHRHHDRPSGGPCDQSSRRR